MLPYKRSEKPSLDEVRIKIRAAVSRDQAQYYLLISLVAFAVTVVITRVFLELTGYPQIGNDVLHIAHALWGGLLLFVAALLPVVLANRWAVEVSALLGGVGTGLFFDEVGKFITQANDYFFPPALPLIYSFLLFNALVYVYLRREREKDPRAALYHALEMLQDAVDGDLDVAEVDHIQDMLAIARQSDRVELVSLADALGDYLHQQEDHLLDPEPNLRRRLTQWLDGVGKRFGRRRHRALALGVLVVWIFKVAGDTVAAFQGVNLEPQLLRWRIPLIVFQVAVVLTMLAAIALWLLRRDRAGLRFGLAGFLISLVALQLLYFYISQFAAVTDALLQLVFLQILLAYRRWYLRDSN